MKPFPLRLAAGLLSATTLFAQSVPSDSPARAADDDIIMLSPFEISADSDVGYVGLNTVAASRLRTDLKDIAAAISPMTAEFLKDIAATSVEEAIEYGMNARMETDDGRTAGPVGDQWQNVTREIRIRGLPGGSRTLDYFQALGGMDLYKIERLELSRGPNSILFGFGSPAGVVNSASKQANLNRRKSSVSLRADSWGGFRGWADVNIPLVQDKLALRAALLKGEDSSWRAAGHNDQERVFLAGTWKIDANTTFKANFELAEEDNVSPRPWFGNNLLSLWNDAGQPTFDNFSGTAVPGNPTRDSGGNAVDGVREITSGNRVVFNREFPYAMDYRRFTTSQGVSPTETDWIMGAVNQKAVPEANWVGGRVDYESFSTTLQRRFGENINAEIAYSRQNRELEGTNLNWGDYGLMADPNLYYPDGTLKPADKIYYYEMDQYRSQRNQKLEQVRAMLSYEREIGQSTRLRLAAMGEKSWHDYRDSRQDRRLMTTPEVTSVGAFSADPTNGNNTFRERIYLSSLADALDPNFRLPGPTDTSGGVQVQDPATGALTTYYPNWITANAGHNFWFDDVKSTTMGVSQLYLLNGRAVLTGGYRRDQLDRYRAASSIRDPDAVALGNIGGYVGVEPGDNLDIQAKGNTFTLGGVVHVTPWLAAFYNTSSSVNVPAEFRALPADPTQTLDVSSPLRDGETQDYGIKLNLFDSRLYVTATRFETEATNDFYFSGFSPVTGSIRNMWRILRDSELLSGEELAFATEAGDMNFHGFLLDTETSGYELEVVGEPIEGWSISLNYSQTESKRSNMMPRVRGYIDHWRDYWLQYGDLNVSQNTNIPGPEYALSSNDWNSEELIRDRGDFTANTDSIRERLADIENIMFSGYKVFEGTRFPGDNKHNFNIRTRYAFRDGPFKGVTIGAGTRFRVGRVAGSLVDWEFVEGTEYTDAFNGRTSSGIELIEATDQILLDLQIGYSRKLWDSGVHWSVQLNVNNAFDERDLIVNHLHANGDPRTYRYQDPRKFILTNTFSF